MPIPLPLRNALATLTLRALDDAAAQDALRWLEAPAAPPAPEARAQLADLQLIDAPNDRLAAMYEPHAAHATAHATKSLAAARRYGTKHAASDDPLADVVRRAEALWHEGLFFEVHEVLEPHWGRAKGTLREALQGLIQVAVAFHHLAHDNPRGARKLLTDGRERLAATGTALPGIDVDALLAATRPWETALCAREALPPESVPTLRLR